MGLGLLAPGTAGKNAKNRGRFRPPVRLRLIAPGFFNRCGVCRRGVSAAPRAAGKLTAYVSFDNASYNPLYMKGLRVRHNGGIKRVFGL